MDFLDPQKKRAQSIKLTIGHTLMAAIVVIGTYILVSQAYGFDVDKKTGGVIQNGLLFVDSAPDSAKIIINGVEQKSKTNTRLALPEGKYNIEVQKDGYRSWYRSFDILGGSVERFAYPMLLPQELNPVTLQNFSVEPSLALQSPDRRWVLVPSTSDLTALTQYDLNSLNDKKPVSKTISFSPNLFSKAMGEHIYEAVEWSTDNNNVLLKHTFKGGSEFIILNRDKPAQSINLNQFLGVTPDKVVLRDKRFDQLYLYFNRGGQVHSVDLKTKQITPILTGVISFKSHGEDIILYSQKIKGDAKNQQVQLKEGDKTYAIREVAMSKTLPLDIAKYDGAWYVVVGGGEDNKTYIYKEPAKYIDQNKGQNPPPITVLKSNGPTGMMAFSQNTRFTVVNSGQHFNVYDAEEDRSYRYDLTQKFDQATKPVWIDGHRMLVFSGGNALIFDYDGINLQTLVPADKTLPIFFNRDYTFMYTLVSKDKAHNFSQTPLRLEADL